MSEKVKAYKGFEVKAVYNKETDTFGKEINCRGFRFEEGKTYEESEAKLCQCGFHACIYPLDVFNYYCADKFTRGVFEYHVVELEDVSPERSIDSKICAKKITIGRKITPAEMIKISKSFPAEPIEDMSNRNLQSCFLIKDDVIKAEPVIRSAMAFGYPNREADFYDRFSYYRLSYGELEQFYTQIHLPDLENYSFWKGVPTQERLNEYYERKKHGRKN